MSRSLTAFRAALYASGFVLVWAWLATVVAPYNVALGGPLPTWLRPLGALAAVLGAALGISCVVLFVGPGRGTPAPFDAPRAFVAVGPYRWVRNPMYLGGAGVMVGAALWFRSPAVLLLAAVFLALAHVFVLLYEEPALERRFGQTYVDYKRRVRRWRPQRPPRTTSSDGDAENGGPLQAP